MSEGLRLAVIGYPVEHSRSPELHQLFARQFDLTLEYDRVECQPGAFVDTVNRLRETGYAGANVTVPYKEDAFAICDTRTAVADLAQAVNTLHFVEHGVLGDNTDGEGFIRDLTGRCGVAIENRTVVIIGAGGAVRGLMKPLLDQNPAMVVVTGRSPYNAEAIAERFGDFGPVQACTYLALKGWQADVLIHASPAGHTGRMPELPKTLLRPDTPCYDLSYGAAHAVFRDWAQTRGGGPVFDGLGMLVEQGAASFERWTGDSPDTEAVLRKLRSQLSQSS
ncbi:shikimate dehydrogenase [uncultured Abyssibacter sp.]|uniref:shikimate dehydrogenase n=1 Tax=uncultured Abyssibacter sp. TaxID=2320202 RepID=UPI0032B15E02